MYIIYILYIYNQLHTIYKSVSQKDKDEVIRTIGGKREGLEG